MLLPLAIQWLSERLIFATKAQFAPRLDQKKNRTKSNCQQRIELVIEEITASTSSWTEIDSQSNQKTKYQKTAFARPNLAAARNGSAAR